MAIQTYGGIHTHSLGKENCRFDKLYSRVRHIVDDLVELFWPDIFVDNQVEHSAHAC